MVSSRNLLLLCRRADWISSIWPVPPTLGSPQQKPERKACEAQGPCNTVAKRDCESDHHRHKTPYRSLCSRSFPPLRVKSSRRDAPKNRRKQSRHPSSKLTKSRTLLLLQALLLIPNQSKNTDCSTHYQNEEPNAAIRPRLEMTVTNSQRNASNKRTTRRSK